MESVAAYFGKSAEDVNEDDFYNNLDDIRKDKRAGGSQSHALL